MAQNGRKLILALDGLSIAQYEQLTARAQSFGQVFGGHKQLLRTEGPVNPQAIWAEFLTGQCWVNNGCAGYARPLANLEHCEISTESGLHVPVDLSRGIEYGAYINIPLVEPNSGGIWLSDGSLPSQLLVSPRALAEKEPFGSYRARPFASISLASADVRKAVEEVLVCETKRLDCLVEVLQSTTASLVVARLNCFDLLNHLLGLSWLIDSSLSVAPKIAEFLGRLNRFSAVAEKQCSVRMVLSAYSHEVCLATINLNAILIRNLLAVESHERSSLLDYRQAIAQQMSGMSGIAAASPIRRFDLRRTKALSVCGGTITINRTTFYSPAAVEEKDVEAVKDELETKLMRVLQSRFENVSLTLNPLPALGLPDYTIGIAGVDFDDSSDGAMIDFRNHPRTTHSRFGFVVTTKASRSTCFTPADLNRLLNAQFSSDRAS